MKNIFLITIISILFVASSFARRSIAPNRFEKLSGVRRPRDVRSSWDQKYSKQSYIYGKTPAKFLAENYHYIPAGATVLDMGMGEGRNAVFLARKGYKVTGVDISSVGVKKARLLAREFGVRINAVVSSMHQYKAPPATYDAIISFYYVDRKLRKRIKKWLRPGGTLIFEAHTDLQRKVRGSERYNRDYLLRPGELLKLFSGYLVLKYEEPLHVGEYTASIILQKPKKK